jgi:4-hydroxybenzoyl-CoA reductase subunit beta
MLRLRPFRLVQPSTVHEAVESLATNGDGARVLGGGTDLLPNLKLGMSAAAVLVSLRGVRELRGVTVADDEVRIGAGTTLDEVASSPVVREMLPALATAAGSVASPQIRRAATLGGNVCLDTRCRYVNQSELFRTALGGCLKCRGDACHVVPGGTTCVAALSSDTLAPLIALDARIDVHGPAGVRNLPVLELRAADGVRPVLLGPAEIVTAVRIPMPERTTVCVFRKWAVRRSIDYPLVSLALRFDMDGGHVAGGKLVLGVLGSKPRVVSLDALAGASSGEALAERVGELAFSHAKPLPNIPYDPVYRRERIAVEARRAARALWTGGGS